MPVVAAQTFEDGDGPQLLLDKDPGHARNADPAQDQDHQAGKAQLSLHALQYLIREVLHVAEPPYPVMSLWREIALQSFQQRLILSLARSEKTRVPHKAAEPGQPRPNRIRVVHHHARERPDIDPIARHILDHSTHCECQPPHSDLIADLEVELRHQSAGQKRAAALQHRVRVTGAACQSHLAVQRELLLNSLQYYRDGPPVRIVHRPHHRLRAHHFRVRRHERRIEVAFDHRLDLGFPWVVGPHLHVTRVHHPCLAPDRSPHLLHQRAQTDDGADADGDAKKEERQPPPRRAHLAPGHVENEVHTSSCKMVSVSEPLVTVLESLASILVALRAGKGRNYEATHRRQNRRAHRAFLLDLAACRVKTERPGRAKRISGMLTARSILSFWER